MSRSVQQPYPPKAATMPRFSQALNEILENVSAPRATSYDEHLIDMAGGRDDVATPKRGETA